MTTNPTRKYLCQAPRSDEYENVEEQILKRLGPNAKEALEATLEQLKSKFNWQLKTGPGRKSNAEHALSFYQYLLDKVSSEEYEAADDSGAKDSAEPDNDDENDEEKAKAEDTMVDMDEKEAENKESSSVGDDEQDGDESDAETDEEEGDEEEDEGDESSEGGDDEEEEDDDEDGESDSDDSDAYQSAKEVEEEGPNEAMGDDEMSEGDDTASPEKPAAKEIKPEKDDQSTTAETNNKDEDKNDDDDNKPAAAEPEEAPDAETCCVSGEPLGKNEDIVKCTTCDRVFLLPYVRPVMQEVPSNPDWRCAYCVLSTEPKHTKQRRESAAAVRLMARLRNGAKRRRLEEAKARNEPKVLTQERNEETLVTTRRSRNQGQTETTTSADVPKSEESQADEPRKENETNGSPDETAAKAETGDDKADTLGDDKQNEKDKVVGSPRRNKRNNMLAKLTDTFSPDLDSPDALGKRSRKQPTLYDPQLVPARDWQSDEVNQTSDMESDDSDSDDDETKGSDKANETSKDKDAKPPADSVAVSSPSKDTRGRSVPEGEVWCTFCGDDPMITICCFCACRVCFCKENKEKVLICDGCEEEYHTYCVDPPLDSIPTEKWHCPPCEAQRKKLTEPPAPRSPSKNRASRASTSETSPPRSETKRETKVESKKEPKAEPKKETKRGPGRPPKSEEKKETKRGPGRPPKSAEEKEAKRGPGRPPKVAEEKVTKRGPGRPKKSETTKVKKRGPGRPPKSEKRGPGRPPNPERRGPGRPPKKKSEKRIAAKVSKSAKTKRKRGRPPKNRDLDEESIVEVVEEEPSPKSSRSGKSPTGRKRGRPPKVKKEEPPKKKMKPPLRAADGRFISPNAKSDKPADAKSSSSKSDAKKAAAKGKAPPPSQAAGATPVVVSRSGRTVKRSSFHDEIDEGEQHLKSYRQAQEAQGKRVASVVGQKKPPPSARAASASASQKQPPSQGQENFGSASYGEDVSEMDELEVERTDSHDGSLKMASQESINLDGEVMVTRHSASFESKGGALLEEATGRRASMFSSEASFPNVGVATATAAAELDASQSKTPRRKPGARECMQISRRFGVRVIPEKYIEILMDYCKRGKVEHLIRMRERLDEHSRYLEAQLAGLEAAVKAKGESEVVVPALPEGPDRKLERTIAGEVFEP